MENREERIKHNDILTAVNGKTGKDTQGLATLAVACTDHTSSLLPYNHGSQIGEDAQTFLENLHTTSSADCEKLVLQAGRIAG